MKTSTPSLNRWSNDRWKLGMGTLTLCVSLLATGCGSNATAPTQNGSEQDVVTTVAPSTSVSTNDKTNDESDGESDDEKTYEEIEENFRGWDAGYDAGYDGAEKKYEESGSEYVLGYDEGHAEGIEDAKSSESGDEGSRGGFDFEYVDTEKIASELGLTESDSLGKVVTESSWSFSSTDEDDEGTEQPGDTVEYYPAVYEKLLADAGSDVCPLLEVAFGVSRFVDPSAAIQTHVNATLGKVLVRLGDSYPDKASQFEAFAAELDGADPSAAYKSTWGEAGEAFFSIVVDKGAECAIGTAD